MYCTEPLSSGPALGVADSNYDWMVSALRSDGRSHFLHCSFLRRPSPRLLQVPGPEEDLFGSTAPKRKGFSFARLCDSTLIDAVKIALYSDGTLIDAVNAALYSD